MNKTRRLILIALNEINFDVVERYIAVDPGRFPALSKILAGPRVETSCEKNYEELEPWIQWVSVHTTRTYASHGIFRLGDILGSPVPQIFELVEGAGYKVGVVSAMNAENRLEEPAYFIPDPWTQTPADQSWWSRSLAEAVSQTVNDNAQVKITAKSAVQLFLGWLRFARLRHYRKYLSLIVGSRGRPWLKALVLDLLLHDVHWCMFNSKRPHFSMLFLNAGAHIQHHYFFNAAPLRNTVAQKNPGWYVDEKEDPVGDALALYDLIAGQCFSRGDVDVVLATGLSQKPYDRLKFYYRLNAHAEFLRGLGIQFSKVTPRMTRDFVVEFDTEQQARLARDVLGRVIVEGEGLPLFGEIDNRGTSLFVTLTYPLEIISSTRYSVDGKAAPLMPEVSFVAIKNGMHQEKGFAFFSSGAAKYAPLDGAHVSSLGQVVLRYFGIADS